jgi:GT2 family glycosyltransferase
MINEPKIGLVTVLYNGLEVLQGFFESLSKQTYKNYILYIVDNSPNQLALNEAKILANKYNVPSVFIYNNANLGVAKGNNQGIEKSLESACDYILLLNNDIEFDSSSIKDMVDYAQNHDESIIVPKIYYYGTNKIWMAGGYISKVRGISPHRGDGEDDYGQYNKVEYVNYAPTCFMLIDSEVFKRVGTMDEKYFVYFDDTDFIYRTNSFGYKIVYLPKCVVGHKVSFSTGGGESLFSIYYTTRNRIYFINKNFGVFFKVISLSYFYLTRIITYIKYNPEQRKRMLSAIYDAMFKKLS